MKGKIILSLFIVYISTSALFSQNYVAQVKPLDTDEWGYINIKGEYLFNARLKKSNCFSKEGFAPVYRPSKDDYFFIDLKGQILQVEITDFRLYKVYYIDVPEGFHDGLARVCKDNKWGYLNTKGKIAIPIKFDKASEFSSGYAVAQIDRKIVILDKQYGEHPVTDNDIIDIKFYSEEIAPYVSRNRNVGFVNTNGEIIIPAQYLAAGYFNAGLAWVKTINGKIGYVNKKNDWVIQPQFEMAQDFDPVSGMAKVRLNGKTCFVNLLGEMLILNDAESFGEFSEGLCWGRKFGKIGFFNNKGEWVINQNYEAVRNFKNGFAAAKIDDKWGYIDKSGSWVIKPSFAGANDMELVDQ
jgi:hypothetical protein